MNEIENLELDDLWFIWRKDREWEQYSQQKNDTIRLLVQQIDDPIQRSDIMDMIREAKSSRELSDISEFIFFCKFKSNPLESTFNFELFEKYNFKDPFISPLFPYYNIFNKSAFLTPEHLYYNIEAGKTIHVPKKMILDLVPFIDSMELPEPKVAPRIFLMHAITIMACKYFFYPPFRKQARHSYFENARVSTKPTKVDSPEKGLHMYHVGYSFKRLKNRPISKIEGNHTLLTYSVDASFKLAVMAFQERKIDLRIHTMKDEIDVFEQTPVPPEKDLVFSAIYPYIDDQVNEKWTAVRKEVVSNLTQVFCREYFAPEVNMHLLEKSEDYIIKESAKQFRDLFTYRGCLDFSE